MAFLLSAVAFIVLLSVLIIIHELGHYTAARSAGVEVEEFGFGLPPRATTLFKLGRTRFTLNWIPFGGFVRLKGENEPDSVKSREPGSFAAASVPARLMILVAGVLMNFLLAIVLLTIGFSLGRWIPTYFSVEQMEADAARGIIQLELGVLIEDVVSGGSAARAGVPEKSILTKIDDVAIERPEQVQEIQEGKRRVIYKVLTGEGFTEEHAYQIDLEDGKSGVLISLFPRQLAAPRRSLVQALGLSLRETTFMTKQTVIGIGHLFSSLAQRGTVPEGVTGLVGIAQLTYASVQEGFMTYLRLVALLSLSLAVLNILPFPALDGGRVIFNRRVEVLVNAFGFFFLLAVIFLITFYDVIRLFN
jgi:regulator of sigma E protease